MENMKANIENTKPQKRTKGNTENLSRRAIQVAETKQRVLMAARRIFTTHPYNEASLRMIGDQGEFNHSFIRYHFHTKANLFEALVHSLFTDYLEKSIEITLAARTQPLHQGLTGAINDLVNYCFENKDIHRIYLLNCGEKDDNGDMLSSLKPMHAYRKKIYQLLKENPSFHASEKNCTMWIFSFMVLLSNYVGGALLYREALGMANTPDRYITFVKESLDRVFYPPLKALIYPESFNSERANVKPLLKPASDDRIKVNSTAVSPSRTVKGNKSRQQIIDAARLVFSRNPYNKATIRKIGMIGDFDFTLYYNYFPNKANLFETVVMALYDEVFNFISQLAGRITGDSLREKFSCLIGHIVDYFSEHPDLLQTFMQDIGHIDKLTDIPGMAYLPKMIMDLQKIIHLQEKKANRELRIIAYGFGTLLVNTLGAATIHSGIIQLKPGTDEYKTWIKDMLMFIFYPSIKEFIIKWRHIPELKSPQPGMPLP